VVELVPHVGHLPESRRVKICPPTWRGVIVHSEYGAAPPCHGALCAARGCALAAAHLDRQGRRLPRRGRSALPRPGRSAKDGRGAGERRAVQARRAVVGEALRRSARRDRPGGGALQRSGSAGPCSDLGRERGRRGGEVIDPRSRAERAIFDEDDSDLADNQEFDRALSAGNEALSQGNSADARVALEKALRYKPRNQRARNLLGLSLFKLGELSRAEEIYRSLIEDHPADPTLRVNLGLVFLKQNASADAVRCFETALDLAPEHQKAQNYLGLALAQKGELARAREWFLKAGNDAMADRMALALQQSPIRAVADSATEALSEEQPFTPATE